MSFVWVAGLLVVVGAASPAPAPIDARVPVLLRSLVGLPADSVAVRSFTTAFRATFGDLRHVIQRRAGANGMRAGTLTSAFRLVPRHRRGEEWKLDVTVHGPWSADATVPAAMGAGGVPMTLEIATEAAGVVGEAGDSTVVSVTLTAPTAPRAAFFAGAGRVAGRLAVEALHHRTGDLDLDATLRLDGARRASDRLPRPPRP